MDRLLHTSQEHRAGSYYTEDKIRLDRDSIDEITEAEHLSGHRINLHFSDGFERIIDFEPFLRKSLNPLIREYLNPEKFETFKLEYGDLIWGDYDLCFPIGDLYEGNV